MITYQEHPPPEALALWIQCVWSLRGHGGSGDPERILPDGSFEMVFHRGDPFMANGVRQPRAVLVGQLRRATLLQPGRVTDVVGLRIRRGGFAALTGLHAEQFADGWHDLRDVLGSDEIPAVMERLTRSSSRHRQDQRVLRAVQLLAETHGATRIGQVAAEAGASERTLERLFRREVGLSPKELARVIRFQAELQGVGGGYYDDAHRCHEFLELAGLSPTALRKERTPMTDHFLASSP